MSLSYNLTLKELLIMQSLSKDSITQGLEGPFTCNLAFTFKLSDGALSPSGAQSARIRPSGTTPGGGGTHHIGQLCDCQFKVHRDRVRNVLHRPDESVVVGKQRMEELFFRRAACTACVADGGKR